MSLGSWGLIGYVGNGVPPFGLLSSFFLLKVWGCTHILGKVYGVVLRSLNRGDVT